MAWMKTLVPMHHTNPLPEVSVLSTEETGMPDNVVPRGEEILAQRLGCSLPDARAKLGALSTDLLVRELAATLSAEVRESLPQNLLVRTDSMQGTSPHRSYHRARNCILLNDLANKFVE